MPRLAGFVHVYDADNVAHVFGPDSEVPDWAVEKITNPSAWESLPEPEPETRPAARSKARTAQ